MSRTAFAITAMIFGRVALCAISPISIVHSMGIGLQMRVSEARGAYESPENAREQHHSQRRAQNLEVKSTVDDGCMHRQWTCGHCSGIDSDLMAMINDKLCFKPIGGSSFVCGDERVSSELITTVQDGNCVEICSVRRRPLRCSAPRSTGISARIHVHSTPSKPSSFGMPCRSVGQYCQHIDQR